ncbi:MAG: di-trans,poly-cis-decaprenylcistransferase [Rickettsiaceae bacterium]|nr:di-trans,poly-cis-decaprenylcistransferase [Rickettsiaceae bacterium]
MEHNIQHLAIIMDGNARWAKSNSLSRDKGHQKGAEAMKNLLPELIKLNIPYFTVYAFSSENWNRSDNEVTILLKLLSQYIKTEINTLQKYGVRLKVIGNLSKLNNDLKQNIKDVIELTKNNNKITVCVALSYGGREELVTACQKMINSGVTTVTEEIYEKFLYDPDMPDVDLLIRPSGVYRISNFLLWQSAYAEFYFLEKCWPDFNKNDLVLAIKDYSQRKRRFGKRT